MKNVIKIEVRGLYNEYDHKINLLNGDQFAIIYGPNGVGKTKILELAKAVSDMNYNFILSTEFNEFSLGFEDGSTLNVSKGSERKNDSSDKILFDIDPGESTNLDHKYYITFQYDPGNNNQIITYTPDVDTNTIDIIEKQLGWVNVGNNHWMDPDDGEIREYEYLARRYGNSRSFGSRKNIPKNSLLPIFEDISIRLIETQRLRIEQLPPLKSPYRVNSRRFTSTNKPRIIELSQQMRDLINKAQTENSNTSQNLDRNFPSRVFQHKSELNEDKIRAEYNTKADFRNKLTEIISDGKFVETIKLPDTKLQEWQINLLDLYLKDTTEKLLPFEELLIKIELLQEIVNSRFNNKYLQVESEKGFKILKNKKNSSSSEKEFEIPLESLSSGEQHEIILIFDLLFNTPKNSLVLIDEPEISLHVVWQRKFIDDVLRVAEVSDFKFIVATHSPQVIGEYINIAQRLGDNNHLWD